MPTIKTRLHSLERAIPAATELPLRIHSICLGGHGEQIVCVPKTASITNVGTIKRRDGEPVQDFRRRAEATQVAKRRPEELSEEERREAFAKADARLVADSNMGDT